MPKAKTGFWILRSTIWSDKLLYRQDRSSTRGADAELALTFRGILLGRASRSRPPASPGCKGRQLLPESALRRSRVHGSPASDNADRRAPDRASSFATPGLNTRAQPRGPHPRIPGRRTPAPLATDDRLLESRRVRPRQRRLTGDIGNCETHHSSARILKSSNRPPSTGTLSAPSQRLSTVAWGVEREAWSVISPSSDSLATGHCFPATRHYSECTLSRPRSFRQS